MRGGIGLRLKNDFEKPENQLRKKKGGWSKKVEA